MRYIVVSRQNGSPYSGFLATREEAEAHIAKLVSQECDLGYGYSIRTVR